MGWSALQTAREAVSTWEAIDHARWQQLLSYEGRRQMNEHSWLTTEDVPAMAEFLRERNLLTEEQQKAFVDACRWLAGILSPWSNNAIDNFPYWLCVAPWQTRHVVGLRSAIIRDIWGNPFQRGHTLLNPQECSKSHDHLFDDYQNCPICDAGLGYCKVCKGGESDLENYCVNPDWLTWRDGTIPKMAEACVVDAGPLDSSRLLVLADALEEAGCGDAMLLGHLRGVEQCPCPAFRPYCKLCNATGQRRIEKHWRGCWAVELLRNRSLQEM